MTLRFKLYALTLVLSAMALVFVVLRANEAIAVRHAIAQAVTINAIADRYLAAAADWAVERGTANTVVANPAAATPAQRQTILQRRQAGDAAFAEAEDGHAHLRFEAANEPAWRAYVARHGNENIR